MREERREARRRRRLERVDSQHPSEPLGDTEQIPMQDMSAPAREPVRHGKYVRLECAAATRQCPLIAPCRNEVEESVFDPAL